MCLARIVFDCRNFNPILEWQSSSCWVPDDPVGAALESLWRDEPELPVRWSDLTQGSPLWVVLTVLCGPEMTLRTC